MNSYNSRRVFLSTIVAINLFFFCTQSAIAGSQKYFLNENSRVEGVISGLEANRIKIVGDRIVEVIGLSERYLLESDERSGQIFIKANLLADNLPTDSNAIFSVITEKGRTQDFKLQEKPKLEGQIIIVENKDIELLRNGKIMGSKHARHDEIIATIKMGRSLKADLTQKPYIDGSLEITQIIKKTLTNYSLEVWTIKNISNSSIQVSEKQFQEKIATDNSNIAAIMIESNILEPQEITKLYKVRYHGKS